MKVIDKGHFYKLFKLDETSDQALCLQFVKRTGINYPGNSTSYEGTNIQDVIRCLIDRLFYVNAQQYEFRNIMAINKLREVIALLESRAAIRHNRRLDDLDVSVIETYPFCQTCGHIGCENQCR